MHSMQFVQRAEIDDRIPATTGCFGDAHRLNRRWLRAGCRWPVWRRRRYLPQVTETATSVPHLGLPSIQLHQPAPVSLVTLSLAIRRIYFVDCIGCDDSQNPQVEAIDRRGIGSISRWSALRVRLSSSAVLFRRLGHLRIFVVRFFERINVSPNSAADIVADASVQWAARS